MAHGIISGCAASAIRLYYAVIVFYNQDFTYIAGATNLWSLVEITSGILAMCLTISPKFFRSLQDSKLWPVFKKRFRTKFRNRSRLPDGTEPVSVSRKGSDKKPTQDDHWMGTSHLLIMRTTHIVTHESTALPPDLENQPSVQPIGWDTWTSALTEEVCIISQIRELRSVLAAMETPHAKNHFI